MTVGLEHEAEPIVALLARAIQQGYLTMDDMITQLANPEERIDEIEQAFVCLDKAGFEVCDDEENLDECHDRPEGTGMELEHGLFDLSDIPCDDSVGLYLKEMGSLPLLTRKGEAELAQRIEKGRGAMLIGLIRCPGAVREVIGL